MKKIILSITVSAALLFSAATYAADKNPGKTVEQAFNREFTQVKDVEWTTVNNEAVYKATFVFNNESLNAFFTPEGEFLGTTRQVSKSQLPIGVVTELDRQYPNARLATVFEYSKKDGLAYYITIVNSNGKGVTIKATGNGELTVYKKNVQ